MCKTRTPRIPAIPPPRAAKQLPTRSGTSAATTSRVTAGYGTRSQVPQFALPVITAKLGGDTVVLGG